MKRLIIRGAVVGVLAGSAFLPAVASAQAAGPLSCATIEQRYSDLMGLYNYNNSLGSIWSHSDLATANYYYGLGNMYWNSAQTYLNMNNVQAC